MKVNIPDYIDEKYKKQINDTINTATKEYKAKSLVGTCFKTSDNYFYYIEDVFNTHSNYTRVDIITLVFRTHREHFEYVRETLYDKSVAEITKCKIPLYEFVNKMKEYVESEINQL